LLGCTCFLADVRMAHLQRHLSTKCIKLNRYISKFVYYARLSTKLTKKIRSDYSTFAITGGRIWGKSIKISSSSILHEKFLSPNIKKFANRILFMSAFRIEQTMLIWPFLYIGRFFGSQSLGVSQNFNCFIEFTS